MSERKIPQMGRDVAIESWMQDIYDRLRSDIRDAEKLILSKEDEIRRIKHNLGIDNEKRIMIEEMALLNYFTLSDEMP